MKIRKLALTFALGSAAFLCLQGCGTDPEDTVIKTDETCPATVENPSPAVLFPNGGETFKVGDKVQIEWCLPENWDYDQSRVQISTNNGLTFDDLTEKPIDKPTSTYVWEITDEYVGTELIVRIIEYGQTPGVEDASDATFTVTAN